MKHTDIWSDKYQPKHISELAVHTKKIQEVVTWFENANNNEILLLTGPSGSGKSACVKALPKIAISIWNSGDVNSFTDFILRASRYETVDENTNHKKVLLIDSLPLQIYEEPIRFHEVITSYKSLGKKPLIIIISDNAVMRYSQHSLIPKSLQQKLNIRNISFNPITITSMKKVLTNIIMMECNTKIKEKRLQEIINNIYNISGGDLRNAINNLQIFFSGMKDFNQDLDMSKDVHLFIFRALGKILYSKRETDLEVIESYYKKLLSFPGGSAELRRAPLIYIPEDVFENSGLESSTFVNYLNENYLDFIEDVHQISKISDYFSSVDHLFGHWTADHHKVSGDYAVSIVSRSLAFYNESKTKNTWRPLKKSPFVDICRKAAQLQTDVIDVAEMDSSILRPLDVISTKQALLDILPFSKIIKRHSFISKMYKQIFEEIQYSKIKKSFGGVLEDNVPFESVSDIFSIKKVTKNEEWTVCKNANEENVFIEIND